MSEINKDLFNEYEELQVTIKELEEKRDAMKPELLDMIPEGTVIDTGTAKFSLVIKNTWKYSEKTKQAEADLKEAKKEEEMTGIAEAIPNAPYIICKFKKM